MRIRTSPLTGLAQRLAGLGCGMLLASASFADQGTADYRHHTMEAIGGHMEAIVDILKGKVSHQAHLALHANAMADMAGIADTLFVEGSQGGNALPAIWEQPEAFAERLKAFQDAGAGLRQAVNEGGDFGPAFQNLGQACKGCHDDFVEE